MKHLTVIRLFVIGPLALGVSTARAQMASIPTVPFDSATQVVTYQGVVQVAGAASDELYSRGREWFATYFNSGKAVLDMDDRTAGKLIGNSYSTFTYTVLLSPFQYELWRTTKIYVKDGRFRYEITSFATAGPVATNAFVSSQTAAKLANTKYPVERMYSAEGRKNSAYWDRKGNPKGWAKSIILAIDESAKNEVESLSKAMAVPNKKKDW